jgi:hypothetical protein
MRSLLGQVSSSAHNVLRYLEYWDGNDTHTYNGSLICLFESRIATGNFWRMDNGKHVAYYDPPTRNYKWDIKFQNDPVPPPGMPVLVEVKVSQLERINKAEAIAALPQ